MTSPKIIACIGSRAITPEQDALLRATAAALVKRGAQIRSGGATGADTSWAFGAASIDPSAVEICLPDSKHNTPSRVPKGAKIRVPPYPDYIIDLAKAEWELGDKLQEAGLPPYEIASKWETKFSAAKSWTWLGTEKPHIQNLMIRNADIIAGDKKPDVILACFDHTVRRGGGTGHGWRLAKALGTPCFNLHLAVADHVLFKAWCDEFLPSKRTPKIP